MNCKQNPTVTALFVAAFVGTGFGQTPARGLGPTRPGVDPGLPFPSSPLQIVNSPVDLAVGGQPVEVINQIGWPGEQNLHSGPAASL